MYRRLAVASIAACVASAFSTPAPALGASQARASPAQGLEAAWVQLGPARATLVRAITRADTCPRVSVDGGVTTMDERAAPTLPDYPVRSCETTIPGRARRVAVEGRRLRLAPARARRIAVIGDTGCRLKAVDGFQACNDPAAWPFERVAAAVAGWRPDLVIQLGDYLYREEPCPPGNAGCAGSPHGYNWATWDADFFRPAAAALAAAPWLFVRGDHELCARAGEGWFRFLDPRPMPSSCEDVTAPYAVDVAGTRMLVTDWVLAADKPPLNPEPYVPQFAALGPMAGSDAWLLSHRPLWGLLPDPTGAGVSVINQTLQAASGNSLPAGVRLVLTGHIHLAEVLEFAGRRPPQIVTGIGGTLLLPNVTVPVVGMEIGGERLSAATILSRHGFFGFVRRGGRWRVSIRDVEGAAIARCRLTGRSAVCRGKAPRSPSSDRAGDDLPDGP
jgi:hypothetical protein